MTRYDLGRLLALLTPSLGHQQAKLELRWMKEAISQIPKCDANAKLSSMVTRRVQGEPLQYILGTQPFGPLSLLTRQPVLIPRPETEDWAIRLSQLIRPTPNRPLSLLDLCTGSGCIPLLLCHLWPQGSTRAVGVDISQDAINLARDNASRCNIQLASAPSDSTAPSDSVTFPSENTFLPLLANIRDPSFVLTAGLRPPFDIITSNPPYIPYSEYQKLPVSVKNYEDPRALLGDPPDNSISDHPSDPRHGFSFYHCIAALVSKHSLLAQGGVVVVEVGAGQSNDVQQIFHQEAGLKYTEVWKDPWEKDRVVFARRY